MSLRESYLAGNDAPDVLAMLAVWKCAMAGNLSIRDLEDDIVAGLKRRAARHGRSAEAEVREILRQAVMNEAERGFAALAAKIRALSAGRSHTPAEILQREGRDER